MIGEGRGKSTQLNPNYDYEDSRNSIPMEGFPSSTGSINIGMDGSGPGLHSSPRQRHYSRDSMDPDGKIRRYGSFRVVSITVLFMFPVPSNNPHVPINICVLPVFSCLSPPGPPHSLIPFMNNNLPPILMLRMVPTESQHQKVTRISL